MLAHARLAGSFVACYALWLVTAAVGVLDLIALRHLVEWTYVALRLDKWGLAAASHLATILFAVAWLGAIMYAEHYYRRGVARRALWRRFARVTLAQAAPLVVTLVVVLLGRGRA